MKRGRAFTPAPGRGGEGEKSRPVRSDTSDKLLKSLGSACWPDLLPSMGPTFNLYPGLRGEPDEALVVVVITIVRLNHLREEGILLREPCIELKYVKLRVTSNKA